MVLRSSTTWQDTRSVTALSRKGAGATTKVNPSRCWSWLLISHPLLPRCQQQEREQLNKKALSLSVAKACSTLPARAETREAYASPYSRRSCRAKEKKENGSFRSEI